MCLHKQQQFKKGIIRATFSVPVLWKIKAAKQCASDKPSRVKATALSVINKALSQTQAKPE